METHRTISVSPAKVTVNQSDISQWSESFLIDRKAMSLSVGTLVFYKDKLKHFQRYCDTQNVTCIEQLSPDFLRRYLLALEETGHNSGGIHAAYRTVRVFLRWFEAETEPLNWKNPITRVKPPKQSEELLEPVGLDDITAMVSACESDFLGTRDKAVILCLLDSGCRASEFLSLEFGDIDLDTGTLIIRKGKGRKYRTVYLGQKSRRALRSYLRFHPNEMGHIWLTRSKERLNYEGLRDIVRRRARLVSVPEPTLHSFRRAFALNCLRSGMDIYSLKNLMGHSDLQILLRYLKQTDSDISQAHRLHSPVDRLYS